MNKNVTDGPLGSSEEDACHFVGRMDDGVPNQPAFSPIGKVCSDLLETVNNLGDLPDHVHEALARDIALILDTFSATEVRVTEANAKIAALSGQLKTVKANLKLLQKKMFAESSERDLSEQDAEAVDDFPPEDDDEFEPVSHPKGKRKRVIPEGIPHEVIEHFPENRTCCTCGCEMSSIGSDRSTKTVLVPEHVKMVTNVYHRCACNKSVCKDNKPVAAKANGFIMRGRTMDLSLVEEAVIQKFFEHSTSFRMARRFSNRGLNLQRQTITRNIMHLSEFLGPLADVIGDHVKSGVSAFMDETPLRVQGATPGKCDLGYLWVTARDERGWNKDAEPAVHFHYAPTRSGSVARDLLTGSSVRYLQTDGYSGYTALFDDPQKNDGMASVRCMAHVRRKVMEAKIDGQSPLAAWVIRSISKVYAVEREIWGAPAAVRESVRQEKALPVLYEVQRRLLENQAKAHGKVASAIKHALNAFDGLKRYCFDGRLEIDSNVVERCIRPVALTKKNSLFAGSHDAARVWAIYNTILGTALLSKIDPREYLKWVVTQIEEQRGDVDYNALVPWLCPLHPFEDK